MWKLPSQFLLLIAQSLTKQNLEWKCSVFCSIAFLLAGYIVQYNLQSKTILRAYCSNTGDRTTNNCINYTTFAVSTMKFELELKKSPWQYKKQLHAQQSYKNTCWQTAFAHLMCTLWISLDLIFYSNTVMLEMKARSVSDSQLQ